MKNSDILQEINESLSDILLKLDTVRDLTIDDHQYIIGAISKLSTAQKNVYNVFLSENNRGK